jgi:hypothetical protein
MILYSPFADLTQLSDVPIFCCDAGMELRMLQGPIKKQAGFQYIYPGSLRYVADEHDGFIQKQQ